VADGDPKGRSTPTLWGSGIRQAEWSWAGNVPSIEANIRGIIVNRMKGAEPAKETLDALAAYVKSLPNGPGPFLNQDGMLRDNAPADATRGFALFSDKAGCMTCHARRTTRKGLKTSAAAVRSRCRPCATCRRPDPTSTTAASRRSMRPSTSCSTSTEEERRQGNTERHREARHRRVFADALVLTPHGPPPLAGEDHEKRT
jgi:mono/diheme cytochrome c family protein